MKNPRDMDDDTIALHLEGIRSSYKGYVKEYGVGTVSDVLLEATQRLRFGRPSPSVWVQRGTYETAS